MTQAIPTTAGTDGELGHDVGFLLSIARAITTRQVNDELEPTGCGAVRTRFSRSPSAAVV